MKVLTVPLGRLTAVEPGLYVTEASDLGIHPGQSYPDRIEVTREYADLLQLDRVDTRHLHEGRRSDENRIGTHYDREGDLLATDYATPLGGTYLRVLND